MKKLIINIIAVSIITVLLLSACSPSSTTQSTSSTTNESTTESETGEKEFIEMSVGFWGLIEDVGGDPWGQALEEKFNVKINGISFSWDNWTEDISLRAATDDLPDFTSTYTVTTAFPRIYEWVDQGLIREIPAEMFAKYPKMNELVEGFQALQVSNEIKGGYYFIPRSDKAPGRLVANQIVIYYRADWMDAVGIDSVPTNLDEYYDLLNAYTFNDPNKNERNDTIGLTFADLNRELWPAFGVSPDQWMEEDGQWIPGYISQNNIEILQWYQKLYRDGILDPEFARNGWQEAMGKLASGTAGSMIRNGDAIWLYNTIMMHFGEANQDLGDPLEVLKVMPPLAKDSNSSPQWPRYIPSSGIEVSAKVDDAKLDRMLEMFEYSYTPEGEMFMRWGIEGEDYQLEGDNIVTLLQDETLGQKHLSQRLRFYFSWDMDFAADMSPQGNPNVPMEIKELSSRVRDMYNEAAIDISLDVTLLSTPEKDDLLINYADAFIQIITGDEDVVTAFEAFVQDAMNKGVSKAIEEINAIVD